MLEQCQTQTLPYVGAASDEIRNEEHCLLVFNHCERSALSLTALLGRFPGARVLAQVEAEASFLLPVSRAAESRLFKSFLAVTLGFHLL